MKRIAVITCAMLLSAAPAIAEDDPSEMEGGLSLMEEGARMLMRGLMSEMEPAIDGLKQSLDEIGPDIAAFAREIGPAFAALLAEVDDFSNYTAPEFLPNGDIIIRRKPDAPIWIPESENDEIEL